MRRILWLMAAILLLVQPAPAIDCSLTGIDGIQVVAAVHGTNDTMYGDSTLFASLIKNQLTHNGIYVIPDDDLSYGILSNEFSNGCVLAFDVSISEPVYQGTTVSSGEVFFVCTLDLYDTVYPSRLDKQGRLITLNHIRAIIWTRTTMHYRPERTSVKSTIKEAISDGISQLVAELRDANSVSAYKKLEEYQREQDERMQKLMQEAKETEKQ